MPKTERKRPRRPAEHDGSIRVNPDDEPERSEAIAHDAYKTELHHLQIELVKLQRHLIKSNDKIVVLLEGRDAAGKDGSIKRIVEYLSPRETRVVALGKPSSSERTGWYFQRYVAQLPVAEEFVLFNRSWYNRAGVEHVMGFCTKDEHEEFMESVPKFEEMLVHSGITLLKYYLDIDKEEQRDRLASRRRDPLKQWKSSPVDAVATEHWKAYSAARDEMLLRTSTPVSPWRIIRTNDKRSARLNLIREILSRVDYADKKQKRVQPDTDIAFAFTADCIAAGRLAR